MSSTETAAAIDAESLAAGIAGRSAVEIRDGIRRLIAADDLPAGTQLPTIRELARAAGVSVGTVLAAWNQLRELGLIETRRRGGTIVRAAGPLVDGAAAGGPSGDPGGASGVPTAAGTAATGAGLAADDDTIRWADLDLHQGAPDRALQPALGDALLDSLTADTLNVFGREFMTARLHTAVTPGWPFAAEAWTTAGGGTEALLLATAAVAPEGSRIAVEEPASPGFLDTARDLGLTPLPLESDAGGPTPGSLADAIAAGAVAVVLQPGAPFAAAHGSLGEDRAAELAAVLERPGAERVRVVEDDSLGPLAAREPLTLGGLLPGRVLRVRSYCKAFGIDVRTSVIGGPRDLVERAIELRSHGVGSNSRILQNALAYLIRDPAAAADVAAARDRYRARIDATAAALRARGLIVHAGPDGIVLWIEVADETSALVALASHGILAAGGTRSYLRPPATPVIRLSPLQLPEQRPAVLARLAGLVADAARGDRREFFD